MIKEIICLMLPIVGMWVSVILRLIIDGKCRKILQAQGRNPNPQELEIYKGIIYPGQYLKRIKEEIEIRRNIDPVLGQWYARTHLLSFAMFVFFVITSIIMTNIS
ncbi:hypothetical protein P4C99_16395 [Pontiellaceae bacterium B1224]|nr:hypothetical protein [Pontiellaceae bacterium B1224]